MEEEKDNLNNAPGEETRVVKLPEKEEALKTLGAREIEPPKKRKYGWIGTLVLLVVIGLSIWLMLAIVMNLSSDEESKSFSEVVRGGDWRFALISLAVLLVMMSCLWFEYVVVMKTTTGKCNFRTSLKVALLGKFYDNITPFAAGGQPMQIYYLHKKGYSGGVSSAVVLIKYFTWMFCWLLVSIVLMACNTSVLDGLSGGQRTLLLTAGWFGVFINLMLPTSIVLFMVLPKFTRALASGIIKLGYKVKIVRDKEKTMAKAAKVVQDFTSSFAIMSAHPVQFILLILLCIVEVSLNFSFPYFIMRMYSGLSDGGIGVMFAVAALNIYVTQSVAIIPTPGNTGAMEGLGALAFSAFVAGSVQFWSMFTWRFAVYYIYIVIGLGITIFEFIRKFVRSRRKKDADNVGGEET